jgi:nonsense-mediated mRNA decay protein 3
VAQGTEMETDGEDEDEGLEIPMDQLIDEMEDVGLEDEE